MNRFEISQIELQVVNIFGATDFGIKLIMNIQK